MVLPPLRNSSKLQTPCSVHNARKRDDWISCTENESLLSIKKLYYILMFELKNHKLTSFESHRPQQAATLNISQHSFPFSSI